MRKERICNFLLYENFRIILLAQLEALDRFRCPGKSFNVLVVRQVLGVVAWLARN